MLHGKGGTLQCCQLHRVTLFGDLSNSLNQ